MINNLRKNIRLIIASCLVVGFVAFSLMFENVDIESSRETTSTDDRIDFFVTDATLTRWSNNGDLISVTQSPFAEHHPHKERLTLQAPYSVGYRIDGSTEHTLSAVKGYLNDDNSRFDLAGDVELHHNPEKDQGTVLLTEQLTYFPELELATSDVAVEFLNDQGSTQGIGMTLNTAQNRLDILSRVRGQYVSSTSR